MTERKLVLIQSVKASPRQIVSVLSRLRCDRAGFAGFGWNPVGVTSYLWCNLALAGVVQQQPQVAFFGFEIIPPVSIISGMIMSIVSKDYVQYQDAARQLNLSPESLRRYIHAKKIEAVSLGRTYYIHRDEVQRFSSERRGVGRPPKKK